MQCALLSFLRCIIDCGAGFTLKEGHDFACFSMTTGGLFAINQVVIHDHFEFATAGWQHGQGFDVKSELVQQFVRQTDGAWCVVSLYAIFDTDRMLLHAIPLRL